MKPQGNSKEGLYKKGKGKGENRKGREVNFLSSINLTTSQSNWKGEMGKEREVNFSIKTELLLSSINLTTSQRANLTKSKEQTSQSTNHYSSPISN